jgi:hypothetical protein
MFWKIPVAFILPFIVFPIGCTSASTQSNRPQPVNPRNDSTPQPEPTKFVIPTEFLNATPEQLCARLAEIKVMPSKDPNDTDPIYEALITKGDAALRCLLEKVTDNTRMADPRSAPHWQHYAVGDTAVFMIVQIVGGGDGLEQERLLTEMLPADSRQEWKTNGVYAYFNYVSEPRNRKALQRWWKKWLADHKRLH